MKQLTDNPSKADELAHWKAFLATLPPCSYLALFLDGSAEVLQAYMRDDLSTELIPTIRRGREEALQAYREAVADKIKAQDGLAALKAEVLREKNTLCRLRDEFRELVQQTRSLSADADRAFQKSVAACVASQKVA